MRPAAFRCDCKNLNFVATPAGSEGAPCSQVAREAASSGAWLPREEADRHDAAQAAGAHEAPGQDGVVSEIR